MDRTGATSAALDADLYPSGMPRADVQEPLRVVRGRAMNQTQSIGPYMVGDNRRPSPFAYASSPDRVLRLWLVGGERLPLFTHLLARKN